MEAQFDAFQLMAMEAVLSPSEVSMEAPGFLPPSIPSQVLCLKIGSALIEAVEKGKPVCITLSEAECWVLRERLSIFTGVGPRGDAGLSTKMILYRLLLEYTSLKEIGETWPMAQVEEKSAMEVKYALEHQGSTSPGSC